MNYQSVHPWYRLGSSCWVEDGVVSRNRAKVGAFRCRGFRRLRVQQRWWIGNRNRLTVEFSLDSGVWPKDQQPYQISLLSGHLDNLGEFAMAENSPKIDTSIDVNVDQKDQQLEQGQKAVPNTSDRSKENVKDPKTLLRLANNRESARKSRLKKKAYVEELERNKLKLSQLEKELQAAGKQGQGTSVPSSGDQPQAKSSCVALSFDIQYVRWFEELTLQINELKAAMNSDASDSDLEVIVDGVMSHYDEIFRLKGIAAKEDAFRLLSGIWQTPVERCFMWLGGFKSSEVIKFIARQLESLSAEQLGKIRDLKQFTEKAEDVLVRGVESVQQALAEILASGFTGSSGSLGNVANYMGQMAMAVGKLQTIEKFVCEADKLRQQSIHKVRRILTTRQAASALIVTYGYQSYLRTLSSFWVAQHRIDGS
ncbi:hypothetical protein J5N97_016626 [Dioscorea zingiberensis]|uniref:DOG1 domain-containing protein n=1 Tax=Dioscorea zingiberensis TaxID=325984 RepID=A0A9D5CJS6_9LILI|nr:hypothetical protein J5N97_016626 [Dioscorea zingiberensis]